MATEAECLMKTSHAASASTPPRKGGTSHEIGQLYSSMVVPQAASLQSLLSPTQGVRRLAEQLRSATGLAGNEAALVSHTGTALGSTALEAPEVRRARERAARAARRAAAPAQAQAAISRAGSEAASPPSSVDTSRQPVSGGQSSAEGSPDKGSSDNGSANMGADRSADSTTEGVSTTASPVEHQQGQRKRKVQCEQSCAPPRGVEDPDTGKRGPSSPQMQPVASPMEAAKPEEGSTVELEGEIVEGLASQKSDLDGPVMKKPACKAPAGEEPVAPCTRKFRRVGKAAAPAAPEPADGLPPKVAEATHERAPPARYRRRPSAEQNHLRKLSGLKSQRAREHFLRGLTLKQRMKLAEAISLAEAGG
eukprot:CAMPEP_0179129552 /NCGR_PEP_ID=MMETSP0796-20121207/61473_1 /TAXON_ID=73915 /ORGANISM="Pyrodinium bahamense, Strain pbaha01" /LENGTH=364 /DNA_ID=CAMNT_0020828435 /DNA_START=23 /DNA_END=1117 /DNA_ORIENTATION=+